MSSEFDESGPVATVCAEIMQGEIDRRVSVFFSTMDGTAQGNNPF